MGTVRPMSNVVKRKKLTKRIALRIPHATWRRLVKTSRLHAITPSELVREALEHYQGHLCPSLTTEAVNGAIDAVTTQAIERDMAAISERTASTMAATRQAIDSLWEREHAERTASAPPKSYAGIATWVPPNTLDEVPVPPPVSSSGPTHPMAQPPGPPGGAGFASVRDPLGGNKVSVASPKRNRR
jgi:hypothetical protein